MYATESFGGRIDIIHTDMGVIHDPPISNRLLLVRQFRFIAELLQECRAPYRDLLRQVAAWEIESIAFCTISYSLIKRFVIPAHEPESTKNGTTTSNYGPVHHGFRLKTCRMDGDAINQNSGEIHPVLPGSGLIQTAASW